MAAKILLIVPPSTLFPIGWAYVAAEIEKMKLDYDVYGFYHQDSLWNNNAWTKNNIYKNNYKDPAVEVETSNAEQALIDMIVGNNYEYILVGGLVGYFKWWYRLLPFIKKISPKSTIIIGGGITKDLSPRMVFDHLNVDYILKGEAEVNLRPLLNCLINKKLSDNDLNEVPGLCRIINDSEIKHNPIKRFDITSTPATPAWESFNAQKFIDLSCNFPIPGKTNFTVLIGRGCPNVCSFCSPTIGRHIPGNIDFVFDELKYWKNTFNFDYFSLASEVAFTNDKETNDFCDRYKKEINLPWIGQFRTDIVLKDETYENLVSSGCKIVSFGFESANDRLLNKMRKSTTVKDHLRNIYQAKNAGLTVSGSFIVGHETETAPEMQETFEFIRKHDLLISPFIGMNELIIYPGTEYYRNAHKKGIIPDTLDFLLTYSNKSGICDINIRNREVNARVNLSAVSDDDFYDLVAQEAIKCHFNYQKNHTLKDIEFAYNFGEHNGLEFTGVCSKCGNNITIASNDYQNIFNISKTCENCYYRAYVQLHDLPEFETLKKDLHLFLRDKKRIVVVGQFIKDILFNSSLNIEYSNIISWYNNVSPERSEKDFFYSKKQIRKNDLSTSNIDAILTDGEIIDIHDTLEINKEIPVFNLNPNLHKKHLQRKLHGKQIAFIGDSSIFKTDSSLMEILKDITAYENIQHLLNSKDKFDYIVYDEDSTQFNRIDISLKSCYKLTQIINSKELI